MKMFQRTFTYNYIDIVSILLIIFPIIHNVIQEFSFYVSLIFLNFLSISFNYILKDIFEFLAQF